MKNVRQLATAIGLTLLVSLLVPVQAIGFDPGIITKTIRVNAIDGGPYGSGATVALAYMSTSGQIEMSPASITNNDGVATLNVDGGKNYVGLAVAPSVSDDLHALEFLDGRNMLGDPEIEITRWDQDFEISLRPADFFVDSFLGSMGSELAPVGTFFTVWESAAMPQELYLPRTGRVGIAVENDEDYVDLRINSTSLNYFGDVIGFQKVEPSPMLYEDWFFPYDEETKTAEMRLREANVAGQLVDSSGYPVLLPAEANASIRFVPVDPSNTNSPSTGRLQSWGDGLGQVNPDGSFAGYVDWLPEGVDDEAAGYVPQVFIGGSSNLPTFMGSPFWIGYSSSNDSGVEFSNSQDMSGAVTQLEVTTPSASEINVRFQAVRKGTATPDPVSIEIESAESPFIKWGRVLTGNGEASYVLPDGDYRVWVTPLSSARPLEEYALSISGPDISLTRCCDVIFEPGQDPQHLPIQITPFESGAASASFTVSGSINDDLRVVLSHPITGQLFESSQVSAYVGYATSPNNYTREGARPVGGGVFSLELPDDYYSSSPLVIGVQLAPQSSLDPLLSRREYTVFRDEVSNALTLVDSKGITLSPATTSAESDSETYVLALGYANVYGNLVDSEGIPIGNDWENQRSVYGNVQRWEASMNRWDYVPGGLDIRDDGSFGLELENGVYRIIFSPSGFDQVAETTTPIFTISPEIPEWSFSNFVMNAPLFAVEIVESGGITALSHAHLQIRNEEQGLFTGMGTGPNGRANLALEPGTYDLVAEAPFEDRSRFPKQTYTLEVTGSPGALSASIRKNGAVVLPYTSSPLTVFRLELGVPNLSGFVRDPNGNPVFDALIMPVDPSTGWDLWELAVPSAEDGSWAIDLPVGTYDLYARTPWGSSQFGNSLLVEGIQVNEAGQVVAGSLPTGATPSNLNLNLRNPAFSGVVVDPIDGSPLTNVEVCLFGQAQGICVVTNDQGRWAMAEPQGFDGFNGWELMVREYFDARYSAARYQDAQEIEPAFGIVNGYVPGQTYGSIQLTLPLPNVSIRVMAGDSPVANAWVSLDRPGFWIGANSDADGYAKFFVESPTLSMTARVDVNGIASLASSFTGTQETVDFSDGESVNGIFSTTISLAVPNFRFTVRNPSNTENASNAWVELFDAAGERWLQGSSTDRNGNGSMRLEAGSSAASYVLKVNPSGNSSEFARNYFEVEVGVDGSISVTDGQSQLTPQSDRFLLTLSNPNVFGRVVKPDTLSSTVRDSFVVPLDSMTDWYLWQLGTNSDRNGEFSMFLEDGKYRLEASVPYYLTGLAKSAKCDIEISGEEWVAVGPGCGSTVSGVVLELREPNLKFRLVKTLSGQVTPVPFSNVGARIGDYSVFTQADRFGVVSMFLDEEEMYSASERALANGWVTDIEPNADGIQIPITFWIDPPWGSDDIVRWECASGDSEPLCEYVSGLEKVGGVWQPWTESGDLGDVSFKTPNTRVQIYYPSSEATASPVGEGAWINLFRDNGSWREWVAGANTNQNGIALFDIPVSIQSSTFSIEINAPWFERSEYPSRTFDGLRLNTFSAPLFVLEGPERFELPTKNLQVNVKFGPPPATSPAKWSWISVEKITSASGSVTYEWLGGNQTDNSGSAAFYLEPDESVIYKLTVHPGPGVSGTRYSCLIMSTVSGFETPSWSPSGEPAFNCNLVVDGQLEILLGNGNVRGKVQDSSGSAIAGAIVLAEAGNGEIVSAVTGISGDYFLELDEGETWSIKVIYVDSSDVDPFVSRTSASASTEKDDESPIPTWPPSSGPVTVDIVLFRKSEI